VTASSVLASVNTFSAASGDFAKVTAVFLPLLPTTPRKAKMTEICGSFFYFLFARHNTGDFSKCQKWTQKNRKPFLISCHGMPLLCAAVIWLLFPGSKLVAYA